uniref:Uncharacterized protein n=1 Tax=Romanomermis culicivorax TaxID=13658 RepID=A0A915I9X8_ROMCU
MPATLYRGAPYPCETWNLMPQACRDRKSKHFLLFHCCLVSQGLSYQFALIEKKRRKLKIGLTRALRNSKMRKIVQKINNIYFPTTKPTMQSQKDI